MAIGTYAQLQTAILDWSNRSDLSSQCPDFITLAESRLYDLLLLKNMEQEDTLTAVVGQNYVALPAGYISPIAMWIIASAGTNVRSLMQPASAEELRFSPSNSIPKYYAIDGANIRFNCPAADTYSMPFRYWKASNLSNSVTTNYLLQRRPDIYLAAGVVELARYTKDEELFNIWEPKLIKAIASMKAAENRARGKVPLRTDFGVSRRSNIFSGE